MVPITVFSWPRNIEIIFIHILNENCHPNKFILPESKISVLVCHKGKNRLQVEFANGHPCIIELGKHLVGRILWLPKLLEQDPLAQPEQLVHSKANSFQAHL